MKNSASSPALKTLKPVMIFCYICGRQYGSKSFGIHVKNCQEKFYNEEQLKFNPKDRLTLPDGPSLLNVILAGFYDQKTLKNYNDDAYQIYKYKVLPKCKYYDRTFNYQSLKVHEKGCDKKPKGLTTYDDYLDKKQMSFRSKTLLCCCVCGRQFGTKSLKIHYPQCLEKFNNDQFMRCPNPKDRRKPPQFTPQEIKLFNTKEEWSHNQIEEFYKVAMERYRNQSMMECYNCKRKFVPQSIQKHMKNCILINGNLNPQAHLRRTQSEKVLHFYQKNIKMPKTLTCYICGRLFGLTSLHIHQKSCYQKFKIQQQNKPKNQRKKLPELPKQIFEGDFNILQAESWQQQKIEKYNKLISDLYNKKTLTQCYICERTFFEESLPKHLVHCENNLEKLKFKRNKSCDEDQFVKRCQSIQKMKKEQRLKSQQKQIPKPRVLMCHICGRQFGTSSLQIHFKSCTQKFKNQQAQKDKDQQKQIPELPEELKSEDYNIKLASQWPLEKIVYYNKIVSQVFNKKTLQSCYVCERTFFEQSLVKHMKFCQKDALQKIKRSSSLNEKDLKILQKHKEIQKEKQAKESEYFAIVEKNQPKALVCHICGRSYGLTSLQIHIPNCVKKFHDLENKKPQNQRKLLPPIQKELNFQEFDIQTAQTWPRKKIEIYNQVCTKFYKHKSLTKCQYCSRTFNDEQIKKHEAFCQKQTIKNGYKSKDTDENNKRKSLKKSQSMNSSSTLSRKQKKQEEPPQPKVLFCHICGRQFGLYSLKIHTPQCKQKFLKQELMKPQNKRKKLPELSFNSIKEEKDCADLLEINIEKAQTWTMEQIKKFNELCKQIYKNQSLYKCDICGRSFKEQQLPKHVKFCEKEPFKKTMKRVQKQDIQTAEQQMIISKNQQEQKCFGEKKVKLDPEIMKKDFSLKKIMSIIEQEDVEQIRFSQSPPARNETKLSESHRSSKVTEFSIVALEVSMMSEDKNYNEEKKYYINQHGKNKAPKKVITLNKSLTNLSLKNQSSSSVTGVTKKSSLSNMVDLNASVGFFKPIQKQEKQCEHCKKKVKPDLYQRHMQMCKSNASMTGYMRKDIMKLKV